MASKFRKSGTIVERSESSLTRTSAASSGFFLVQTLSGFGALTLGAHLYGPRTYGIWLTILATTTFLGLAVAGLPLRTLTHLARLRDGEERADTYAAGFRYALVTCVVAACLLLVLWLLLPDVCFSWTYGHFASARGTALLVFVSTLLIQPTTVAIFAIAGLHDVSSQQRYLAARALMRLTVMAAAGAFSHHLFALAVWTMAGDAVIGAAALLSMRRRLGMPLASRIIRSKNPELRRRGVQLSLIQAELAVIGSADAIVIASFVGPSLVTAYVGGQRLFLLLGSVLSAMQAPLWPAYSRAFANREAAWIDATYKAIVSLTTTVTAAAVLLGGVLMPVFLPAWLGSQVHVTRGLTVVLGLNAGVAAYVGIHGILLTSLDKLRPQATSYAVEAVANVVLSVFLVQRLGVIGVAIGTLLPALAVGAFVLPAAVSASISVEPARTRKSPISASQVAVLLLGVTCLILADRTPSLWSRLLLLTAAVLALVIVWMGRRPILAVYARVKGSRAAVATAEGPA